MLFYDLSFQLPQENLAFDDFLLKQAQEGSSGEALRFWESSTVFAVLGRISPLDDVLIDQCRRDNVQILRRSSGGGTVLQGPGCLNFSFVLSKKDRPYLNDLRRSYQEILYPLIEMLGLLGIDAVFHPVSDLALQSNQKKFSGNAQRRAKDFILHHGTLLYDFDLGLMQKYLAVPKIVPDYREGRDHTAFVANINIDESVLKGAFLRKFSCQRLITDLSAEQKTIFQNMKTYHVSLAQS